MDSDMTIKNFKKPIKIKQKITQNFNIDIMINLV